MVALPAGTFVTNGHLQLKTGVELKGAGAGTTTIKAGPNFLSAEGPDGGYPVVTTHGASNVTIADLTADQSGDKLDQSALPGRLAGYLIDVRNSTNALVTDVATNNPATYSIAAVGSTQFCVEHSSTRVTTTGMYDQLDGIHVMGSSFGYVLNNNVDQRYNGNTDGDDGLVAHTMTSTPTHDITYAGNTVRAGNGGDGVQLAAGDGDIYNITIQNNEFYGSPEGIRTGWYNDQTGKVHDVLIGGSAATGNSIHGLVPGTGANGAFPSGGQAGWFFAAPNVSSNIPSDITMTYNSICDAGSPPITMVANSGNVAANNTTC
ncbi:hypothetical protein GCM10009738_12320 [Kitasatospora viridis]